MGALIRLCWDRHPLAAEDTQVRCEEQKGSQAEDEVLTMSVMDEATHRELISEPALVQDGQTRLGSLRWRLVLAWRPVPLPTRQKPQHQDR